MDRMTNDMMDMAKSYDSAPSGEPMMQDDYEPQEESNPIGDNEEGSAREMAERSTAANDEKPAKPEADNDADFGSSVMDNKQLGQTITKAFESDDQQDAQRHDELMASQKRQTGILSGVQDSVRNMFDMMFDDKYGPNVETYKRDEDSMGSSVAELARQQAAEHREHMEALQQLRYAMMNAGGMGGLGGGLFGGGGGDGKNKKPKPGGRPQGRWARMKNAVKGAFSGPGGTKKKILAGVAAGAGALFVGSSLFGDDDPEEGNASQRYPEERQENQRRAAAGLPPLEGQELVDFRASVTESYKQIPNPETGYALESVQSEAVRAGLYTPEEVVQVDKSELTKQVNAATGSAPSTNARPVASQATGGNDLVGGETPVGIGAGQLAMGAGTVGAGAYMLSKGQSAAPTVPKSVAPDAPKAETVRQAAKPSARMQQVKDTTAKAANVAKERTANARDKVKEIRANRAEARANAPTGKKPGFFKRTGGKVLPGIGIGLTAYEAVNIIGDENKTTGEKAGALTDMGGGLAGGFAGAKGGALAGAALGSFVPGIGTAIGGFVGGLAGGVGGYLAGEGLTKSAREWVGGLWGDDEEEAEIKELEQASARATGPAQDLMDEPDTGNPQIDKKVKAAKERAETMKKRAEESGNVTTTSTSSVRSRQGSVTPITPDALKKQTGQDVSDPEKDSSIISGLTAALGAVPTLGGVISANRMLSSDKESANDEEGSSFNTTSAIAMSALPVVGAIQSATSAIGSWFGSGGEGEDEDTPKTETSQMKAANAQELFDNEMVPALKEGADKPEVKSDVKTATKAKAEAEKAKAEKARAASNESDQDKKKAGEKEEESLGTVMSTIMSTMFGDDMVDQINNGGPAGDLPDAIKAGLQRSPDSGRPSVARSGSPRSYADYSEADNIKSKPTNVSADISTVSQNMGQAQSASNVSTKAVSETDAKRSQYESVQKVLMVDPTVKNKKHERKEPEVSRRSPSTSTYESRSIRSSVEDSPVVVSDFGLALLNTGFI